MKIAKQEVTLLDHMGSDLSVVNAARVSFHKESLLFTEQDAKLINYLAKHNHWSPFAHTTLTFRVKAPIFVARQLVKHQVGGVWNEVSRRYVSDEPEFYLPDVWRGKPENAKQGSSDVVITECDFLDEGINEWWTMDVEEASYHHIESCLKIYDSFLTAGIAPEQARMVLPQNTMTEWWWTGSLVFFARVCKQRLDAHAQQETQEIAQLINEQIKPIFPVSWKALMEN